MMRCVLVLGALALTACAPAVPNSGSDAGGVGFENYGDYNEYRARRDAELTGSRDPATVVPPARATVPAPAATPPVAAATPTPTARVELNNPGISDEQEFDAVSGRESIESDAERLRAQREAYQVIEPTAVPRRSGSSGPNIVAFALSTTNAVGQKVYRRSVLTTQARFQRNCAKYASSDLAQEAFLRSGGPERDRIGLDPDGDGFACSWDPSPFRRINS